MKRRPCIAVLAAVAALGGCATLSDRSELRGDRYFRASIDTYPVVVTRVDDRGYLRQPVYVEPGVHEVTVQAPPGGAHSVGNTETIRLDVKPCTRYYLVAVKPNRLSQEFTVRIDHEEAVSGCRVS